MELLKTEIENHHDYSILGEIATEKIVEKMSTLGEKAALMTIHGIRNMQKETKQEKNKWK